MTERASRRVETLLDVYLLLPALYSYSSAKAYRSAFDRAERLTGERLAQIPAEVVEWEKRAAKISWAGEFTRARTQEARQRAFDAFVNRISAAIRKARAQGVPHCVPVDVASAWNRLADYVAHAETTIDADGVHLLPNQSSRSIDNLRARLGMHAPHEIDTGAAVAALALLPPDKATSYRNALRFYNKLIAGRDRHAPIADLLPPVPVGPLPTLRDRPMDWSRCTASFREDMDRVVARALRAPRQRDRFGGRLGPDPVAERRRATKGRKRPVRNRTGRTKAFRSALSWLARHACPDREDVYGMDDVAALLTGEAVAAAVDRFIARTNASDHLRDAGSTTSLSTYLSDLQTIAQRTGADEDLVWEIEDLRLDFLEEHDAGREMSATREAFVKLVDRDPAIARAIITGPRVLLAEARRLLARKTLGEHQRTEALHLFMAAAMLAIQLARPLRTRNVNELTSEGSMPEIVAPRRERASAWLDITRDRVKNRKPLEGRIPDWLWQVIAAWIEEGRPAWRKRPAPGEKAAARHVKDDQDSGDGGAAPCANDHLFPSLSGEGPISRGVINKAWNRGMARLGLTGLTPHMMRHVAATIYLARHPGDYAVVAALLADSLRTVETFYARGEGRAAMDLFAQVLMEIDPTLNLKGAA